MRITFSARLSRTTFSLGARTRIQRVPRKAAQGGGEAQSPVPFRAAGVRDPAAPSWAGAGLTGRRERRFSTTDSGAAPAPPAE